MERNWTRALTFAQARLDDARIEAEQAADYLADMLSRGVETTSAFTATEERYDEAKRVEQRWAAVVSAASSASRP